MGNIENDLPIKNINDDLFNRASFAKNIADIIYNLEKSKIEDQGIVFGLNGSWGSGKSSLINLIKNNLIQKGYQLSSHKKIHNIYSCIWKSVLICIIFSFNFSQFFLEFDVIEHFFDASPFLYYTLIYNSFGDCGLKIFLIILVIFFKPFEFILIRKAFNQVKNFCSEHFQNILKFKKAPEIPIILDFNPWNNCNEQSILKDFFNLISNHLFSIGEIETQRTIQKYASKILHKCSNGFIDIEYDQNDSNLKESISTSLKKSNKRFIIFIDDLDRLSSTEIVLVFKIIKSIANLPNIIYFLSYDEAIVSQALNDYHKERGHDFLDKIIQVSFEMPICTKNSLDKYLKKELEKMFDDTGYSDDVWEQKYKNYWSYIFSKNFVLLFNNARDVKRFVNTFNVTFTDDIAKEVNIVDFWFITAVKLFLPELSSFIKMNKEFLTQKVEYDSTFSIPKSEIVYVKENFEGILRRKCLNQDLYKFIYRTMLTVFPSLECIYKKFQTIDSYNDKTRMSSGRICCAEHFDKYFMYDVGDIIFTNTYINNEIDRAKDKDKFAEDLRKLDDKRELKNFLEKLEDFIDINIDINTRKNIINTLFENGDYYNLYDDGFLERNINVVIERVIYQILKLKDANPINILRESFSAQKSLMPALTYIWLINNMIINKQSVEYANETEYNYYSDLIIKAIKEWAGNDLNNKDDFEKPYNGRLIEHRDAGYLLNYWQQNEKGNDLKNYIYEITKTNSGLLKFIDKLKSESRVATSTGYKVTNLIHGYSLKPFFEDLDALKRRLQKINKSLLTTDEITILDMTLNGIDNIERPNYEQL